MTLYEFYEFIRDLVEVEGLGNLNAYVYDRNCVGNITPAESFYIKDNSVVLLGSIIDDECEAIEDDSEDEEDLEEEKVEIKGTFDKKYS